MDEDPILPQELEVHRSPDGNTDAVVVDTSVELEVGVGVGVVDRIPVVVVVVDKHVPEEGDIRYGLHIDQRRMPAHLRIPSNHCCSNIVQIPVRLASQVVVDAKKRNGAPLAGMLLVTCLFDCHKDVLEENFLVEENVVYSLGTILDWKILLVVATDVAFHHAFEKCLSILHRLCFC